MRIAIIGAGITGLSIAHALQARAEVVVFEKSRGVGGRMSTRYADPYFFDHGAQYFTVRDDGFRAFISPLIAQGIVQPWQGKSVIFGADGKREDNMWFEPHYVACPHMNSLCKALAHGVDVRATTEVAPLHLVTEGAAHTLHDTQGNVLGTFDWVISTAPPEQSRSLLSPVLPALGQLDLPRMLGCHTLMLGLVSPWKHAWIAARVREDATVNGSISWIAANHTKPGRNRARTALVVQTHAAWSEAHINDPLADSEQVLTDALTRLLPEIATGVEYKQLHRWRYASRDAHAALYPPMIDEKNRVAAAGDWCSNARVENGWLAAQALLSRI